MTNRNQLLMRGRSAATTATQSSELETLPASQPPRAPGEGALDVILDWGIYAVLACLIVYFAIASPYFLSPSNFLNIGSSVAVVGVLAVGMTIGLIAGQVDLTIGAVIGLTTVVISTLVLHNGFSFEVAIAVAIGCCLLVGLVNGILIVDLQINSIIATLAMSIVITGAALIVAKGLVIPMTNLGLVDFISARPLGIPVTVAALALAFVLGYVVMAHTTIGWHIYAVGGSPSSALRAGIRVGLLIRLCLVLTALLAGVGGVITAGESGGGAASYGLGIEFSVLSAVLIGGASLGGGAGKLERTLAGVLLIGVLGNGMVLLNVDSYYQGLAKGAVFLFAVVLGALRQKRLSR